MKKIIKGLFFAVITCLSFGLMACAGDDAKEKTELIKELPQEVVCGSEIYFKEYLPVDFESEYQMTVSYFDCTKLEQVNDEKVDSLMFRFSDVSKYDFKLNKVGAEPILFSIDSLPVKPELAETFAWQTDKGETVLMEDLVFWCNISLKNEDAKIDPTYKLEFMDVEVRSIFVDGTKSKTDLSGETAYTFGEEAEYIFTIKASNISGEHLTTVQVTTMNLANHANDICGYVFDENDTVEFELGDFDAFQLPADGESLRVRVGDEKYDAVYNADENSFKIANFTQELTVGEKERLYLADKDGVAYSVNIVVPDLVIRKTNFEKLATVKDGVVILAEDIDMKEIPNYGSSRTGVYSDYWFRGVFDGRGYTISNYTTRANSFAGSLLWSVDGATIKNIIFKNAKVLANNSVLSGRTKNYTKFINIAIEVNELATSNSSIISGPGDYGSYYENCILYAKASTSTSVYKSGFVNGMYCRSAEFKNAYLVSDLADLPVASIGHEGITPAISGTYTQLSVAQAEGNYNQSFDWGTSLLNKAASTFFCGPATYDVTAANVEILQTATEGIYRLTEDITLDGTSWTPSETFTGTLDGNGHKIVKLNGSLFKAINGATICNLVLDGVVDAAKGVLCSENLAKDVTVENVIVKIANLKNGFYRTALLGYQTGGTATLKNVVVDMFKFTDGRSGYLTTHAGGKQILQSVYFVGGDGNLHSTTSNSAEEEYQPAYYKADGATVAAKGTDYFVGEKMEDFESSLDTLDVEFKALIENFYFPKIQLNSENIDILQTATNGYYILTDNVDLSGKTWAPSAAFTGTLNGNGYKISNLTGSLFKSVDNATICNLILDDVTTQYYGVIAIDNLAKDVTLTNVIVKVKAYGQERSSLLGYQVGGTATLKNVIVDMPVWGNDLKGLLTTHAGTTQILENVYCIGANGTLHSNAGNHDTLIPAYVKADGVTNAVKDTDYFIGSSINDFTTSIGTLDEAFKALVSKCYQLVG